MNVKKQPLALITGGRRGIGLGVAHSLASAGYHLALTGLAAPNNDSQQLIEDLAELGSEAIYLQSDLADLTAHETTIDTIVERFGNITCLVNNAGIASVKRGDFLDLDPSNFDTIIQTNLRGTIFFTQAVVRRMLAEKHNNCPKSIINITSVSSVMVSPERMDYCITKAGLTAFSAGLAVRLADEDISVFEVRPGVIRSDMTSAVSTKYDKLIEEGFVPAKRWGEPKDVSAVVVALASGAFGFSTGSIINIDGALSINRL